MKKNITRDSKGKFVSTKRSIKITPRLLRRFGDSGVNNLYESKSWFSNDVWAVRKDNISNLDDVRKMVDMVSPYGGQCTIIEKTDVDFFDTVNYESEVFHRTDYLKDFTHTADGCVCRIFRSDSGKCVCLNDTLCTLLKVDKVCYGKENKAFITPDRAVIIMPFYGTVDVVIKDVK